MQLLALPEVGVKVTGEGKQSFGTAQSLVGGANRSDWLAVLASNGVGTAESLMKGGTGAKLTLKTQTDLTGLGNAGALASELSSTPLPQAVADGGAVGAGSASASAPATSTDLANLNLPPAPNSAAVSTAAVAQVDDLVANEEASLATEVSGIVSSVSTPSAGATGKSSATPDNSGNSRAGTQRTKKAESSESAPKQAAQAVATVLVPSIPSAATPVQVSLPQVQSMSSAVTGSLGMGTVPEQTQNAGDLFNRDQSTAPKEAGRGQPSSSQYATIEARLSTNSGSTAPIATPVTPTQVTEPAGQSENLSDRSQGLPSKLNVTASTASNASASIGTPASGSDPVSASASDPSSSSLQNAVRQAGSESSKRSSNSGEVAQIRSVRSSDATATATVRIAAQPDGVTSNPLNQVQAATAAHAAMATKAHSSGGYQASAAGVSGADTFAAIDKSDGRSGPTWTQASGNHAEAGFQDPQLGWISVRADISGTGVHASLVGSSDAAAQVLGDQLSGLRSHLAEQGSRVADVGVALPQSSSGDGGTQQGMGQNQGYQQNPQSQSPSPGTVAVPASATASNANNQVLAETATGPAINSALWQNSSISVFA